MKKIKACALRFEAYGEEFSAMDIKLTLGLDVCTATIVSALRSPGQVRWGIARANEGTGATLAIAWRLCVAGDVHIGSTCAPRDSQGR